LKKRLSVAIALFCVLAVSSLASAQTYEIKRADYGSGNNWVDVTGRVQSLIQRNRLNFTVTSSTLGASARQGRNRALRLQLRDTASGQTRQATYRENQQVNLRVSNMYQNSAGLRITRAIYGYNGRALDVTSRLNSQIQNNQLNLQVNNQSMGGDPAQGAAKSLTVDYTLNGQSSQRTVREGEMLTLSGANASNNGYSYGNNDNRLQITRATYGSGNYNADVTSRLNSQVQSGQLNIPVNNQTMGGDPAPQQSKRLTVQYAVNGQSNQIIVNEGDTLRLPDATYNGNSNNGNYNNGNNGNYNNNAGYNNGLSQRVRCESTQSNSNSRQYCSANTRGGVRLIRQISNASCVQGTSWGYDNNNIWVANGCGADFELQSNGGRSSSINPNSGMLLNGTELSVRTNEPIDSNSATNGQSFSAQIAADVLDSNGAVMIPRGSDARLVIRSVNGSGTSSNSDLVLDVDTLTVSGRRYSVSTGDLVEKGGEGVGANKRTAIMVGGGAGIGTLIGAIVGGGKGAAIGAAIGAGAGLGTEVLTKGKRVQVPTETVLNFKLDQDLRLQAVN
jgi:outer membrane lipoprotein SlyB